MALQMKRVLSTTKVNFFVDFFDPSPLSSLIFSLLKVFNFFSEFLTGLLKEAISVDSIEKASSRFRLRNNYVSTKCVCVCGILGMAFQETWFFVTCFTYA